jgi:hypothetical protein
MRRILGVVSALLALLPAGGAAAAPASRPTFPAGARFDYQIGGAYRPAEGVVIVDRDRHSHPATGRFSICYVNAFQAQPGATTWWRRHHPGLLLKDANGHDVIDRDWSEVLFDVSTAAKRRTLAAVEATWLDGCARKGFRAVEPDNLDSWTRSRGRLDKSDAVAFAKLLSKRAHRDKMLIAQKNTPQLSSRRKNTGFDFAIAEECAVYRECGAYTRAYGRKVIEIEYTDNGKAAFARACTARRDRISIELLDRDVRPAGTRGHVRRWCA